MTAIAIYDMDKTVTRRATYGAFLAHMALGVAPWRLALLPLVGAAMLGYVLGLIGRTRVKEINQALMIGHRVSRARLLAHVERYADKVVRTNLCDGALRQIAADRAEGRVLVMASASYRLYVAPIARRLGFDHVIATDHLGQDTEWLHARIAGENCYDAAKLAMIEGWMRAEGIDRAACHVRAYSDHVSDAPLLGWADEAVAANPHRALETLARLKGWRIARW